MKKLLQSATAIALFAAFTGCSSDDSNETVAISPAANGITAKINGADWTPTATSVTLLHEGQSTEQRLDIISQDSTNRITLTCGAPLVTGGGIGLGSYTFTSGPNASNALFTFSYLIGGNSYMEHFPQQGVLTITACDAANKKISGIFTFSCQKAAVLQQMIVTPDTVDITDGAFTNLTYTELSL